MQKEFDYSKYVGWQFRHKGREEGFVDCWGLVLRIYQDAGICLEDPVPDYPEDWDKQKKHNYFLENYHKQWDKLDGKEEAKPLDVILFGRDQEFPDHIGVVVAENRVLHSARGFGVILTRISRLRDTICGHYRLKGRDSSSGCLIKDD